MPTSHVSAAITAAEKTVSQAPASGLSTLAIDIGGTGLKALILGPDGAAKTERVRVETPHPATPEAVLAALVELVKPILGYDRISVGFPGVVVDGVTRTAPNLDKNWRDFDLAAELGRRLHRTVRVLNDAGVQGYGVIEGHGVEMVLTFGTGMGTALYNDGVYVPNLELAHHPFRKGKTYEEYVCNAEMKRIGKKKWNKRVARVIAQVLPIWNPRRLYLGGGNAKHLKLELPPEVQITSNVAGLMGGIALWKDHGADAASSTDT
ncbi:MAG TPA: ROK family protein [Kofleriaceae bacterium]|jgi:polyphosphate glucokinase|nr:ROK family protein [Kofleriaceae bacterium]